ncbi:MAG: hypothetical protein ACI31V_04005 [Bacilli bacterium]
MKEKATKIVFVFFIGLSLIFFIIGILSLTVNLNKKKNCTDPVIATVTQIRKSTNSKHKRNPYKCTYRPVFSYEYNNIKYEIKYGKGYKDKNTFEKEKEYKIYVNPKYPSQFIIEGHENDIDTLAIASPIIGVCMTTLFSTIYIIYKKRYNKMQRGLN